MPCTPINCPFAILYTSEQTCAFTRLTISLPQKDWFVVRSIPRGLLPSDFTSVKDIERQLSQTLWPDRQSGDLQSASGPLGPPYPAVFRVIPGGMAEVSRSAVGKEERLCLSFRFYWP